MGRKPSKQTTTETVKVLSPVYTTMAADKLTIPAWNPQIHNEENIADIKRSIKEFGYVEPIIVRGSDGLVVGGAGRLMALKELWAEGWTGVNPSAVPVIAIECDDRVAKKLNLALNNIRSYPDIHLLATLINSLLDEGETVETLTVTGYKPFEIEDLANVAKDIANHMVDAVIKATERIRVEPDANEDTSEKQSTKEPTGSEPVVERRFRIPLSYSAFVDDVINKANPQRFGRGAKGLGLALICALKVAAAASDDLWQTAADEVLSETSETGV